MVTMPPLRCVDILAHKLPSETATSSGTAVDGEVLCATIRSLQVSRALAAIAACAALTQLALPWWSYYHHQVHPAEAICMV
jgi:hypothetical protein